MSNNQLQKMTALVIDGQWQAHWVTMNGTDAKTVAETAMDELASDFLFDNLADTDIADIDPADADIDEADTEEMEPDPFEIQLWKDDCRLVRVWAGEHSSVPEEAALYEDGDWPMLPAPGTVIEIAAGKVEVMADLPAGYRNWQNNPFLIPVKAIGESINMRKRPDGFMTWPHGTGLMITADNI